MEYKVKHKVTGEVKTLSHLEINDMVYNDAKQIIVFNIEMEAYILLEDN